MAVIGTFSQFTTARLAIYASQASLSVTGNNISNINTPGYTRQRMDLVSLYSTGAPKYANLYNTNIGYGVLTNGASQLRDIYLDIRFRNENTKLAANDAKLDGLYQLGNILDEVGLGTGDLEGFGVIEAQFGVFFEMLNKGTLTNYGAEEYDDLVRSAASTLTAYFRKAASDLEDIKVNKVNELRESISEVNKLLTQIRDLNVQIRTQGIYGDKALELRDARNLAIDQLSSYIPIDVTYSMERIDQFTEVEKLTITIKNSRGADGQPIKLVDGIYGGQLSMPNYIPKDGESYQEFLDRLKEATDYVKNIWEDGDDLILKDIWNDDIWKDCDPDDLDELKSAIDEIMKDTTKSDEDKKREVEQLITNAAVEEVEKSGIFNFDEYDALSDESLYLLCVEQLVDQRGRVMNDPNTPSGKSEAILLEDTAFCAKSADATADPSRIDSNALGSLQAIRELLTRRGEYSTADDIARDSYATNKRGIRYYELALDSLARKFAEIFNEANQLPLETVYGFTDLTDQIEDASGNPLIGPDNTPLTWGDVAETVKDANGNDVLDENGNPTYQFKTDTDLKAMIELVRKDAKKADGYSYYQGGVLISNRGDNNDPSNITAANISVSYSWSNHSVRLLNTKQKFEVDGDNKETDHSTIRDNIAHMVALFDTKWDYWAKDVYDKVSPDNMLPVFHGSFREVFTAISATLAEDYNATAGKVENYSISTLSLDNDRLSVSGVDLNDEATSMMQFSKSYSAACRLLTTIDSMLDTLINGTAR